MKWLVWLICFYSASSIAGTIYRTIGPDGKVSYSSQKPAQGKVTNTFSYDDLPSTPVPKLQNTHSDKLDGDSQPPLQRDMSQPILFYAQWCGYCRKAKAYLSEKNISYRGYDIDTADGGRKFKEAGGKAIPLLINGAKSQQGFSRSGYDFFFSN